MFQRVKAYIRTHIPDDSGDAAIEAMINLLIAVFLIVLFIKLMPIVTIHTSLSHVADELARTVELTGQLDSAEYTRQLDAYKDAFDFMNTATISITADNDSTGWFDRSQGKFAFRAPFTLVVSYTYHFTLISPTLSEMDIGIDVPVSKTVYGTAEIYWKE